MCLSFNRSNILDVCLLNNYAIDTLLATHIDCLHPVRQQNLVWRYKWLDVPRLIARMKLNHHFTRK